MVERLNRYLKSLQRFLRDGKQEWIDPGDLITYVNQARREVAMRTQCIRRVPPISGGLLSIAVTAGGSGYVAPTVTISDPDFPDGRLPFPNGDQATATAIVQAGVIVGITLTNGGSGYFNPTITITDSVGTGATATATMSPMNLLLQGQEQYNFSDFPLDTFPGVESVFAILSVSVIYANYRYSIPRYSFSTYQAKIRQYPYQYSWVPTLSCQLGQGVDGSLLMYPIPSQSYQVEIDCFCLPSDLQTNDDYDAVPDNWRDAVAFYAAHLAFLELQNGNTARMYLELYDRQLGRFSQAARPSRAANIYGRW